MSGVITITFQRPGSPVFAEARLSEELVEFSYADVLKAVYWKLKEAFEAAQEETSPAPVTATQVNCLTSPRCPFDNYAEPCPVHPAKQQKAYTGSSPIRPTLLGEFVGACGIINCSVCLDEALS